MYMMVNGTCIKEHAMPQLVGTLWAHRSCYYHCMLTRIVILGGLYGTCVSVRVCKQLGRRESPAKGAMQHQRSDLSLLGPHTEMSSTV